MTTKVTITGTGCPIPSADRAGPGVLVQVGELALQFDAGRSTVQRLAGAGLWPTQVSAVFVTHHHSDHLTGLADLTLTRWVMARSGGRPPLPIIAPKGPTVAYVERMLDAWDLDISVRQEHTGRSDRPEVALTAFELGDGPTVVWEEGAVRVLAGEVRHEPVEHAVGYRIETPDGVVVITGDTLVCDEVALLAEGADVLVYEAMRFEPIEALPVERQFILDYHADTRLIGAQAAALGVKTLILTHLIPEPVSAADYAAYEADIRDAGFTGELVVADDLHTTVLE